MNDTGLKGRTILKVAGILYIISSSLSILIGMVIIVGGMALSASLSAALIGDAAPGIGIMGIITVVFGLVMIVGGAFSMTAGVLGIRWRDRPDKAGVLFVLGLVLLVVAVLNLLYAFGGDNLAGVAGALIGLVPPVVYTLGAWQNKQSLQ